MQVGESSHFDVGRESLVRGAGTAGGMLDGDGDGDGDGDFGEAHSMRRAVGRARAVRRALRARRYCVADLQ